MRKREQGKLHVESVLALLVFGVFSCCVTFVLMAGARVYNSVIVRDEDSADKRTCAQYLTTKVRQAPGSVCITGFGDGDALVLLEEINGQQYATWIYCHNGWLCELFGDQKGDFSPEDGERVLKVEALTLKLENGVLCAQMATVDGDSIDLRLHIRGGVT